MKNKMIVMSFPRGESMEGGGWWRAPRAMSKRHFTAGGAPLRALACGYDCLALSAMSLRDSKMLPCNNYEL